MHWWVDRIVKLETGWCSKFGEHRKNSEEDWNSARLWELLWRSREKEWSKNRLEKIRLKSLGEAKKKKMEEKRKAIKRKHQGMEERQRGESESLGWWGKQWVPEAAMPLLRTLATLAMARTKWLTLGFKKDLCLQNCLNFLIPILPALYYPV